MSLFRYTFGRPRSDIQNLFSAELQVALGPLDQVDTFSRPPQPQSTSPSVSSICIIIFGSLMKTIRPFEPLPAFPGYRVDSMPPEIKCMLCEMETFKGLVKDKCPTFSQV